MTQRNQRWALVIALLVFALVVYPLSVGPSAVVISRSHPNSPVKHVVRAVYLPLDYLPKPVQHAIDEWASLWIREFGGSGR